MPRQREPIADAVKTGDTNNRAGLTVQRDNTPED